MTEIVLHEAPHPANFLEKKILRKFWLSGESRSLCLVCQWGIQKWRRACVVVIYVTSFSSIPYCSNSEYWSQKRAQSGNIHSLIFYVRGGWQSAQLSFDYQCLYLGNKIGYFSVPIPLPIINHINNLYSAPNPSHPSSSHTSLLLYKESLSLRGKFRNFLIPLPHSYALGLLYLCHKIPTPLPSLRDVIYEWSPSSEKTASKLSFKPQTVRRLDYYDLKSAP